MENESLWNRFKNHIWLHDREYLIGITCLAVGVVAGVLVFKKSGLFVINDSLKPQINQKASLLWKSNMSATQIIIDARGSAGNVVRDITTGTIYPSQNAAAKALGVDFRTISKHLKGKYPDAAGHILEKLIDGSEPRTLQRV